MTRFFKNFFSGNKPKENQEIELVFDEIVQKIKNAEQSGNVPLGRKIYSFECQNLEIRFDRDITKNGRICIFEGGEKLFSFTVFAKEGEYNILKNAFESVSNFLNSDRSIKNLPENQVLKGFYHQH